MIDLYWYNTWQAYFDLAAIIASLETKKVWSFYICILFPLKYNITFQPTT